MMGNSVRPRTSLLRFLGNEGFTWGHEVAVAGTAAAAVAHAAERFLPESKLIT